MPKKEKQLNETLFWSVLCVACGLKDAYLVDCVRVDAASTIAALMQVASTFGFDAPACLVVVDVDGDIFIVNKSVLVMKCAAWREGKLRAEIVDLRGEAPAIATDELRSLVAEAMGAFSSSCSFASSGSTVDVVSISRDSVVYASVGGPALAGILLGYPFVYFATPHDGTSWNECYYHASLLLSHRSLVKASVQATIDIPVSARDLAPWKLARRMGGYWRVALQCLEFTLPSSIAAELGVTEQLVRGQLLAGILSVGDAPFRGWRLQRDLAWSEFVSESVSI